MKKLCLFSALSVLFVLASFSYCGALTAGRFPRIPRSLATLQKKQQNSVPSSFPDTEFDNLKEGYRELVTGSAISTSNASKLLQTPEDFVGVAAIAPLVIQSLKTAITGQLDSSSYAICALVTLLCGVSHLKMAFDTPRDYRAPKLAEYHSVYEFSALYLLPFSWLLWRITPHFPAALESLDVVMCSALTIVTVYGCAYAWYAKTLIARVNNDDEDSSSYNGPLQPSSPEYQAQAQLYLTGNIVINTLACLFLPFAWTLCFRGTDWWERVQALYPSQAAFLGVSVLVAIVGDVSGNLLLRSKQLDVITSPSSIVVLGIVSNILLLVFPEVIFNTIYLKGVSEVGFYWE